MEFNEKLQELRKKSGLTQAELAQKLYVSRTAISKWESGRGVPSIESLKEISKFFKVSLDDLLSGEELIIIAENECTQNKRQICDLLFGLFDCCMALLFFLPFFGQNVNGEINNASLFSLSGLQPYLKIFYSSNNFNL